MSETACNLVDPCPRDALNDIDSDGLCSDLDTCPFDSDNDVDDDNLCASVDPCPWDAENDADGDGVCGNADSCPYDGGNDVDSDSICGDVDLCNNLTQVGAGCDSSVSTTSGFTYEGLSQEWIIGLSIGAAVLVATVVVIVVVVLKKQEEDREAEEAIARAGRVGPRSIHNSTGTSSSKNKYSNMKVRTGSPTASSPPVSVRGVDVTYPKSPKSTKSKARSTKSLKSAKSSKSVKSVKSSKSSKKSRSKGGQKWRLVMGCCVWLACLLFQCYHTTFLLDFEFHFHTNV